MPCVVERFDLRLAFFPGRRFEQDVIRCVRIEGRIKIDQVDAFVRDLVAKDAKIIALEKLVQSRPRPADQR